MTESVLERLGTTESTTLALAREAGGKIRVTGLLWEDAKVVGKHEVLEVGNVDGRLHIAHKARRLDEWTPQSSLMTPRAGRGVHGGLTPVAPQRIKRLAPAAPQRINDGRLASGFRRWDRRCG